MVKKYRLAKGVEIKINNQTSILIKTANFYSFLPIPYIALFFIQQLNSPKSIKEIGESIQSKRLNRHHTLAHFKLFNLLIEKEIIVIDDSSEKIIPSSDNSVMDWGNQNIHKKMLHDEKRTFAFEKAIKESVKGKTVLDIGCGTGILSLLAIKHGAKHVYAIDGDKKCVNYTNELAKKNNVSDKITVLHNISFDVKLPELCDILISEVIGNSPLGEDILDVFIDAKKRLLKPIHQIIPENLSIYCVPVSFKKEDIEHRYFTQKDTISWQEKYNLDFSPLLNPATNTNNILFLKPEVVSKFNILGPEQLIEEFNFNNQEIDNGELNTSIEFNFEQEDCFNGLLIYFDTKLSLNSTLSINPKNIDLMNSWKYVLYPLNDNSLNITEQQNIKAEIKSKPNNRSNYIIQFK